MLKKEYFLSRDKKIPEKNFKLKSIAKKYKLLFLDMFEILCEEKNKLCDFLTPEIRPNQQHFVNISSVLDEPFKLKFQKIKNKIIGIDMIDRINEIFPIYFVENILLCLSSGKLSIEL